MLVLFAVVAFVGVGWCIAGLGPASQLPEGLLSLALLVVGFCLLVVGCALLVVGLFLLLGRREVLAGWYVDPDDPGLTRWWDGSGWTEHTAARSAATIALAPLRSSSTRRRLVGAGLLVGGVLVAAGASALADATVTPVTDLSAPTNPVPMLASQLVLPALGAAVVGVYLLLTLSPDPRPGWYADPLDEGRQRWWDGLGWNDSTSQG